MSESKNIPGPRIGGRTLLLVLSLSLALALIHFSGAADYLDPRHWPYWQSRLENMPPGTAIFFFIGAGALAISIGLGRSAVSLAAGMLYGAIPGTVYSVAAALLGSLVIFGVVRYLSRPDPAKKFGRYFEKAEQLVSHNGLLAVILIRQLPLACLLINVLLALTRITLRQFILGSLLGFLPESLIFALYGSSARQHFFIQMSLATMLLVSVILFSATLRRRLENDQPQANINPPPEPPES